MCLCPSIPAVAARTRVVIVRHHLEKHRSSNTGRLAHLALHGSEILDYGGRAPMPDLPRDAAWLLFPEGEVTVAPPPGLSTLIVLDATWSQARRMYRKLPALRGLPTLRLPDIEVTAERLRESPGPGRVSTIEAIAAALRLLEGDEIATPLEALFQNAVRAAATLGRRHTVLSSGS